MTIFIDTNIYLKFYHYSNAELEELKKLIVLVEEGQIRLIIPRQVLNEYQRNRETKIADALKMFREEKLNNSFPVFFKEYEEFDIMRKAISEYNINKKQLLEKVINQIENYSLKADEIINELIQKAGIQEAEEHQISSAKLRFDLGNPPGKNNSYGDAVNWEILLQNIDIGTDLYFLSDDKDYFAEIDNSKFNKFLEREWKGLKMSNVYFFKSLSDFFKAKYPSIKLASDIQKEMYIERLELSMSFQQARYNLYKLSTFDGFTSDQIKKILEISLANNQIAWIIEDYDINKILYNLIDKYGENVDEEIKLKFIEKVKKIEQTNNW